MPKINQSIETSVMDKNGNIESKRANRTLSWGDEPSYIKLYLQDVMYLRDMPKQYAALAACLLRRVSYAGDADGMCVTLVPRIKRAICKEMGWKRTSTLDNSLHKLIEGKIIYRLDRGIYKFNPYLFGKGDWQDIARLRLEIDYSDIKGRTFKTNIEYQNKNDNDKQNPKTNQAESEPESLPA